MTLEEVKIFVEDLEETILRLHVQLRAWEEECDQWKKVPYLKREKRAMLLDRHQKYVYYKGKFYAYYHTLLKLGSDVPRVLQRLRGIEMTSSVVAESKMHYTEIYGHFPTVQSLESKKVVK